MEQFLWNDAPPPWAQYLAMNEDGDWWWFEVSPEQGHGQWFGRTGRTQLAFKNDTWWIKSVSARPN